MFELPVTIKQVDLSPEYLHVHHTKCLLFLEQARLEFLRSIGFSCESLIKRELFPVIVSINVRYLREVVLGDYKVSCEDCQVDGRSLFIKQVMRSSKGKVAVEAMVESMLLNGKTKRAVVPESEFIRAFSK